MESTKTMDLIKIATIRKEGDDREIVIDKEYIEHCTGLDKFSHIHVLWWAGKYEDYRFEIPAIVDLPYAPGQVSGLFSTLSPVRPNPLCSTVCEMIEVDLEKGVIKVDEIDAFDATVVVDIKPYYSGTDRVEHVKLPDWAADWPKWRVPEPEENYEDQDHH
ncbi:MAG: SAM-dependent methyltransferase [Spirochaetales bacterium]|nr:SAM-dependent methyltransferase [Spirochaetales bacterium]